MCHSAWQFFQNYRRGWVNFAFNTVLMKNLAICHADAERGILWRMAECTIQLGICCANAGEDMFFVGGWLNVPFSLAFAAQMQERMGFMLEDG